MRNDRPRFELQSVYDDGTSSEPEIATVTGVPMDTRMDRRGLLGLGGVFGGSVGAAVLMNAMPASAQDKIPKAEKKRSRRRSSGSGRNTSTGKETAGQGPRTPQQHHDNDAHSGWSIARFGRPQRQREAMVHCRCKTQTKGQGGFWYGSCAWNKPRCQIRNHRHVRLPQPMVFDQRAEPT